MEEMIGREEWRGTDGLREGEEVGRMTGGWCGVGGRDRGLNWKQDLDTIYFRFEHQRCLGVYDVYHKHHSHRNLAKIFHNFS